VFENRVLWKIFGLKRDEVTGEWRRQHNEELYGVFIRCYSDDQIRMGWARHVARMGNRRGAHRVCGKN
jgi:hypothetical protein